MKNIDILIVGVGGQGTLLASNILGNMALETGKDVKLSEVHGMSQRGGSVVTHVRIADKVASPIIDEGGADVILAFEKLEAARWISYLKPDGILYSNTQEIMPLPVITGAAKYPEELQNTVAECVPNVVFADALSLAKEAGNIKTVNTVMIGLLAKSMDVPKEIWHGVIEKTVKPQFIDVNKKAFDLGLNYTI